MANRQVMLVGLVMIPILVITLALVSEWSNSLNNHTRTILNTSLILESEFDLGADPKLRDLSNALSIRITALSKRLFWASKTFFWLSIALSVAFLFFKAAPIQLRLITLSFWPILGLYQVFFSPVA